MSEPPFPQQVIDTLLSYQKAAALASALELRLFSAIHEGACRIPEIARACDIHPRGAQSLADFMVAEGFLTKNDATYALSAEAARFLVQDSPSYMGSVHAFLHGDTLQDAFRNLTTALRLGRTALQDAGTMNPEHPAWLDFARGMVPVIRSQSQQLCARVAQRGINPRSVLDIACGHGLYGIAAAQRWPTAQLTLQDWEPILEVARENAAVAGVGERLQMLAGDAHQMDLGGPHDLVLVANFLHHFSLEACVLFLRRLRQAMAPGGMVVTLESLIHEDRVTPADPARFSLVMLATTEAGDAFTGSVMEQLYRDSGFASRGQEELEEFGASACFGEAMTD